jgi:hypothetical protein
VEFLFARIPAQNFCKDGLQLLINMDHDLHIPIFWDL